MTADTATATGAQETAKPAASTRETGSSATEGKGAEGKPTDAEAALLKENMSMKSELKKLKAAQEKAEQDKLAEGGKFKELHEKAQGDLKAMQARLIQAEVKAIAVREGIADLDFVRLADLAGVSIEDDGSVSGAAEAIAALKAAKPILFGVTTTTHQVPGTAKPGKVGTAGGFSTLEDWEAAPSAQRTEWAEKHPEAFIALCERRKGHKTTV